MSPSLESESTFVSIILQSMPHDVGIAKRAAGKWRCFKDFAGPWPVIDPAPAGKH
jgi:hypothetical protein